MSILSSALAKVGISKDAQRKLTGVAGAALAPVTGGLSGLIGAAASAGKSQVTSVLQNAVKDATGRVDAATTAVKTADAAATAQGVLAHMNPLVLLGAGVVVALLVARSGGE